jgi:glycosyltransferase involved in cell wall biosynthesis
MVYANNNDYIIINPPDDTLTAEIINLNELPFVSFCIPTKNNEDTIENCLKSVISQNYPKIEIIIIDGYSSDKTIEIAKKYTDKIFYDSNGYGSACQIGVEKSTGLIIASIDSDIVIPHKNWLKNAVKFFNYSNDVCTIWPKNVAPPDSSLTTQLYFNIWRVTIEDRIKHGRSFFGGGNSLFLKKCFLAIGGVDPCIHWGADFDWARKFKNRGYKVVFSTDPLYHDTMRTLREFYKKQFLGAKTFTNTGFGMMGLSNRDIFYENFILGIKCMFRGIIVERDRSWILYPVFLTIRIIAYSATIVRNRV